jgi:hypothetical protein
MSYQRSSSLLWPFQARILLKLLRLDPGQFIEANISDARHLLNPLSVFSFSVPILS